MRDDTPPLLRRLPPVTLAEDVSDGASRTSRELSYLARWPTSAERGTRTLVIPTPQGSLRTG